MDLHPLVGSSRIVGYGWERSREDRAGLPRVGTLAVEFVGGARWLYFGVPERVFEDWLMASSRGAFFARFIRDRYEARVAEAGDGLTGIAASE